MRYFIALVAAALTAATLAPAALADDKAKRTLGPQGYDTPGKSALVEAGTANVELGNGDHVVICHAIGGANGTEFVQIAPSAQGVVAGHDGHEGDRDIVPPFVYAHGRERDASLAGGNNWNAAGIAIYRNGCKAPAEPTTATPPITPTTTTTTTTAQSPVVVPQVVAPTVVPKTEVKAKSKKAKAKKAKKVKKARKAKTKKAKRKAAVKGVRAGGVRKGYAPRVLPRTR